MSTGTARADLGRYWSTMQVSAGIGVGREGGLQRLALTDADRVMRDRFVDWCCEAGLSVTVDRVGNIFARRAGRDESLAPVLIGSHLDTQANGGCYDGIAGVLAGLEVVRTLNDLGHVTRRPIEVVNWTNEEGARFSPPMLASGCFAGAYALDWAYSRTADDGRTLRDELERIGYLGEAPVGGRAIDSYFELHIEQGPALDHSKTPVGVVTHGYRSYGLLVEFRGDTAHTGPWPMEKRRNALVAGARLLVAVDDIGWAHAKTGGKATGSQLLAWPNKPGTLSDWAQVVCDVRHERAEVAAAMREAVLTAVQEAAGRAQCDARIIDTWEWGGDLFDAELVALLREQAELLGHAHLDLPSQAGHDAYFLARICPTAMVFVPCRDGITHNNHELTTPAECEPGLNVLLHSVLRRADR